MSHYECLRYINSNYGTKLHIYPDYITNKVCKAELEIGFYLNAIPTSIGVILSAEEVFLLINFLEDILTIQTC